MGLLFIAILAFSAVFIQLNMGVDSKSEKGKTTMQIIMRE